MIERLLRVRKLAAEDENLRDSMLALDQQLCRDSQNLVIAVLGDGEVLRARVMVETVSAVLRAALDEWARLRCQGRDVDPVDVFHQAWNYLEQMLGGPGVRACVSRFVTLSSSLDTPISSSDVSQRLPAPAATVRESGESCVAGAFVGPVG